MKINVLLLIATMSFMLCIIAACSRQEKVFLEGRSFEIDEFSDADIKYRPLPIIHNVNLLDKAYLTTLKEDYGYGGVVINVPFIEYLENEEGWMMLEETVKTAIDELGLRIWIYDEFGYPSGTAGGLVLRDNPEWQSKGLVEITSRVDSSGIVRIEKPYGHNNLIFAKAYRGTSIDDIDYDAAIDLIEFSDSNGNINWVSPSGGWFIISHYSKYFFEGTHGTFNWYEIRRQIDVSNPEPVKKFIEVTHQRYYERVGKYFGNGIEAFFTDEPSYMGTYFIYPPPTRPGVRDEPDDNIPLLPTANWSPNINNEFERLRGYEIGENSTYLFGGSSDEARRFRWDYYKTTSELFVQNYIGQISQYLGDKNVALSGHFLFEEDIYMHSVFSGNYMQMQKQMQYPGIDLLTSHPYKALEWAVTNAKFASSAAHFDRRSRVHSEISDAFDGNKNDVYGRIGAVAVQYAFGINTITSFYPVNGMSREENRLFTDVIGRMGYMLDGGLHEANIALYYPIEGIWVDTLPPENLYAFNENVRKTSDSFRMAARSLTGSQLDFHIFDSENLIEAKVQNGKLTSPGGGSFSAVVVSDTPAVDSRVINKLIELAEAGVKIVIQGSASIITENGSDAETINRRYNELRNHENVICVERVSDIAPSLDQLNVRNIYVKGGNDQIIYTKKTYSNSAVYMLVNASQLDVNLDIIMNETGSNVRVWDPFTSKVEDVYAETNFDRGTTEVNLKIESGRAMFITIED